MKAFIWKLKFAAMFYYRTDCPFRVSWDYAGSALENLSGDTTYSPFDAVQDEFDSWSD
jgi:hypothetical protein